MKLSEVGKNVGRRGFTLVEVLVVVSILGLVASVALANLQGAKEGAQIAAGQQFNASLQRSLGGVGTIARWTFDEGEGGTTADISGNGIDGTVVGATFTDACIGPWSSQGAMVGGPPISNCSNGFAMLFDGNDYIEGSNFPLTQTNGRTTMSLWINPTSLVPASTIFRHGQSSSCTGFQVVASTGQIQTYSKAIGPVEAEINQPLNGGQVIVNNKWQHVVIEYSGNVVTTYLNGRRIASTTLAGNGTSQCNDGTFRIGQGFQGLIDDLTIYSTDLTLN